MDSPAPRDLLSRAQDGDTLAVDQLLANQLPGLRAFIRLRSGRLLRAKESASDLAQSVCREVLEELPGFEYRGEAAFRQWLYRAAERKLIDRARYYQAGKRDAAREATPHPGTSESDERLLNTYRTVFTPSQEAIAREELTRIECAFERLSEPHREVITLSRIVGLSHADIARELGKSEGAVRTQLCRALAELSDALAGG